MEKPIADNRIEDRLLIVKYDKDANWFNVYMPNGEAIVGLMDVNMIADKINETHEKRLTVRFECLCKFVDDEGLAKIRANNGDYLDITKM